MLVRHPRLLEASTICYGRLDIGPHPASVAETANAATAAMAALDRPLVWSSPARRCLAVAQLLGPTPAVDDRLLELHFGAWEGLAWDDVDRAALDLWAASPMEFAPPGGESGASLVERVRAFHAMLDAAGRDCVVVSHGGPLKVLRNLLAGEDVDLLTPAPGLGSVASMRAFKGSPAD